MAGDLVPLLIPRAKLPEVRRALRRAMRPINGTGEADVKDGADAISIYVPKRKASAAQIGPRLVRMRVKSISNAYLTCRRYDGVTEGTEDIIVARPLGLRHSNALFPNVTSVTTTNAQTIEVTDGDITEVWKVTPDYVVDQDIHAMQPDGGTGIEVGGNAVLWLDINESARAWAVDEDA